jgi:hypothetical protein
VFIALLVATSAASALADPGSGPDRGSQVEVSGLGSGAPLPGPEEFAHALAQAERQDELQEEAREEELASPRAQREREASLTAYATLSAPEAQSLLGEAFPEALAELNADPARTLGGLQIEKVLSPNVARVSNEEGGSELVESSIPIEVGQGAEREPVDLSLRREGDSFAPVNPLAEVQLPATASGEVELEDGVGIESPPGEGDPGAHRFGQESLFYPNTDASTDTLIAPTVHGVEIFEQLRSPESPERFRYPLALPQGASLKDDGRGGAEVTGSSGQVLAAVPAPSATDAQGTEVPVSLEVEGDSLVVGIDHRSGEFAYPLLLDPLIEQALPGNPDAFDKWTTDQSDSDYTFPASGELHVHSNGQGAKFEPETFGQFLFEAPGSTAFIKRAAFSGLSGMDKCTAEGQPHGYVGIFNVGTHQFQKLGLYRPVTEANLNPTFDTGPVGGPEVRLAAVGLGAGEEEQKPECAHDFFAKGATLTFEDPEPPSLGPPSGPGRPVGERAAPITIPAEDTGFGVFAITAQTLGSDGQPKSWTSFPSEGCTGLREQPCPASVPAAAVTYFPAQMPEGTDTLTITAQDPAGHVSAPQSVTVTVDHTPPDTTIDQAPPTEGTPTGAPVSFTYHSSEPGSSFECKLDSAAFAPCAGSGMTTAGLANGPHTFSVRASDEAENTDLSPASTTFFVGPPRHRDRLRAKWPDQPAQGPLHLPRDPARRHPALQRRRGLLRRMPPRRLCHPAAARRHPFLRRQGDQLRRHARPDASDADLQRPNGAAGREDRKRPLRADQQPEPVLHLLGLRRRHPELRDRSRNRRSRRAELRRLCWAVLRHARRSPT